MRNSVWSQWVKRRNALNAKKQKNRYEKNRWDKGSNAAAGGGLADEITDITTEDSLGGSSTSGAKADHSHAGMPWISVATFEDLPTLPDDRYAPGCFAWVEEREVLGIPIGGVPYQNKNDVWVRMVHFYSQADLSLIEGANVGDLATDIDDGHNTIYWFNGSSWVELQERLVENRTVGSDTVLYHIASDVPITHFVDPAEE